MGPWAWVGAGALLLALHACTRACHAAPLPSLSDAIAKCSSATVNEGRCETYPPNGVCASLLPANASVYVPVQLTLDYFERLTIEALQLAETNKDIAGPACFQKIVQLACVKNFLVCVPSPVLPGVEDLPILPCASFCAGVWKTCQEPFRLYWLDVIGGNYASSPLPNCALGGTFNASWGATPQPPDVIGGRVVPKNIPIIQGLTTVHQFPLGFYAYNYVTNASLTPELLTCNTPPNQVNISAVTLPRANCSKPLNINAAGDGCVLPCPFPTFDDPTVRGIQAAYTAPGIFGFILCIFVCLDSMWLINQSKGWADRVQDRIQGSFIVRGSSFMQRIKLNALLRREQASDKPSSRSNNERSFNTHLTAQSPSSMGSGRNRQAVQSSTWYALVGSLLGILYFVLGPAQTLVLGSGISCGSTTTIDVFSIGEGAFQLEPNSCIAQRASIFVLHAIFNLIANSMVRVYLVVRNERMSWRQSMIINWILDGWCYGEPLLAMFLAFYFDALSTDVFIASVQLSRQSAVCMLRLTSVQEWLLLYFPIIATGFVVVVVSYLIARLLIKSRKLVAKTKASSGADLAMRLLVKRLVGLGLATLATLCVVIASSTTYTVQLSAYNPALITYLQCIQAVGNSLQCVDCTVWQNIALENQITPGALGAMLASESMIVVLFAGFFTAQSLARVYRQRIEVMQQRLERMLQEAKQRARDIQAHISRRLSRNPVPPPPGLKLREQRNQELEEVRRQKDSLGSGNPVFQQLRWSASPAAQNPRTGEFEYRMPPPPGMTLSVDSDDRSVGSDASSIPAPVPASPPPAAPVHAPTRGMAKKASNKNVATKPVAGGGKSKAPDWITDEPVSEFEFTMDTGREGSNEEKVGEVKVAGAETKTGKAAGHKGDNSNVFGQLRWSKQPVYQEAEADKFGYEMVPNQSSGMNEPVDMGKLV